MSAWRREALQLLPKQRLLIERAWSPMALWIELRIVCERAILEEPMDRQLVSAIFAYARRCLDWPNQDVLTAVALAFYESIVILPEVQRHLHNWITPEEFEGMREVFAYHLGQDGLERFSKEFYERIGSSPRGRKPG